MKTHTFIKKSGITLILRLILILGLPLIISYQVFGQSKVTSKNRTTFLFIDKTSSVTPDTFVQEKNLTWLKKIVKENAIETGDKIIISFIFENTSSLANKYEFIYHPPKPSTVRMSSSEARLAKVKFDKRLRAYKKSFTEKIINKAFSHEPTLSGTDIMGTIQLLSNYTPSETGKFIKAYYFSDMMEASTFRNLQDEKGNIKLKSFDHAQELAKEDSERLIKRYKLPVNCLSNISEVNIIFPAKELDSNKAFALLPEYWTLIFKSKGIQRINYY